ncbi:EAL domain-containing protein [Leptolyngbya sp. AN02str]|uniref:EAL domain-containing protein n=1 Tax=Leptolyngbya sp. AN02str TaxID=3423363 RepID=UPI003D3100CB
MNVWFQRYISAGQRSLTLSLRVWRKLIPGTVALLLLWMLMRIGIGPSLENLAYDALFQIRGELPWSDRIIIVEIDESRPDQSSKFFRVRDRIAAVLSAIALDEPSVVAVDILMPDAAPEDSQLATAIDQLDRVVLAQSWNEDGIPILPTKQLDATATATGHIYRRKEVDGLVRRVDLQRQGVNALALVATHLYLESRGIIPAQTHRPALWINWLSSSEHAQRVTYQDIIENRVSPGTFRDRIVLVGLSNSAIDSLQTPYNRDPATNEIYLDATVISNLLERNSLHVLGREWTIILLVLGGPVLSILISRWRLERRLCMWLVLTTAWGGISIVAFQFHYWLPVALPIMLVSLTSAVVELKEQNRVYRLLRQSEERYALAVRGSNGGLWDWNLNSGEVYYSQRWKEMVGCDGAILTNRPQDWYGRVHPDDIAALKEAIANHLEGRSESLEHEHRIILTDGSYRWMLCRGVAVRDRQGRAYRMAGSQLDITERKLIEEKLWRNAYYDDLTGLPNRVFFVERLRRAIVHAQHNPLYFYAVLLLDVDRFQVVNNSLGNAIGDQLLVAIGHRLKGFFPVESVIARLSGDEFAILVENIEHARDANRYAEQIQHLLSLAFNIEDHEVFITVSIGITLSSSRYTQPERLLQDADTAMYKAKAQGKACFEVFDPAMHNRMLARLTLENDLRRAITYEQRLDHHLSPPVYSDVSSTPDEPHPGLMLYYQPIVALDTQTLVGFEALARWQHPRSGLLGPKKFIGVAEETGLIIPLGWWIMRQACRQLQQWQSERAEAKRLIMSVNLSSRQFVMADLAHHVHSILSETGLEPTSLKLELTEGTIMESGRSVIDVMHQVRSLGVQLAIDDFGTGYSSLSYLSRFPIDTLKIDRSFVAKMTTDSDSSEVVRAIVTLAHNLNMDVTAEGVETEAQSQQLLNMECEFGQGFFFAKPLDVHAAEALLAQHLGNS